MDASQKQVFYNQVREAVHHKWDPIGVTAYSDEMGEYDSYIPALCNLLEKTVNQEQVFEYLWAMETDSMGMEGDRKATTDFSIWIHRLAISYR